MYSAILITYDKEDAINEAKGLCDAAGYQVVHTITAKFLQKTKIWNEWWSFRRIRRIIRKT